MRIFRCFEKLPKYYWRDFFIENFNWKNLPDSLLIEMVFQLEFSFSGIKASWIFSFLLDFVMQKRFTNLNVEPKLFLSRIKKFFLNDLIVGLRSTLKTIKISLPKDNSSTKVQTKFCKWSTLQRENVLHTLSSPKPLFRLIIYR